MNNKLKLILIGLLLISGSTYAQSTLNATSGGGTIAGNSYNYSIGEMTLVSTESGGNIVVTQGLLQPTENKAPDAVNNIIITQGQLNIYPNPSSAIVYLQPQFDKGEELQMTLLDLIGKVIRKTTYQLENGNEKQQIDISSLANGSYLLNINYGEARNSYKILKQD